MALAAYATEYNIAQLSSNQVSLASKLVKVLSLYPHLLLRFQLLFPTFE